MRRSILPAMLAVAALLPMAATADARQDRHRHGPKRVTADLTMHVSKHNVLAGSALVVRGRVSPSPGGAHRVRVVVEGPSGGQLRTATNRRGVFRARWGLHSTGLYEIRAYGIHDRRVTGSRSATRRVTVYRQAAASYYGPG